MSKQQIGVVGMAVMGRNLAEARVPMGLGKWQHIEALGKLPAVDARWQAKFGRSMSAADIDASTPLSCRYRLLKLSIFLLLLPELSTRSRRYEPRVSR